MIALLVALGAAVGAPTRYLTDRAVQTRHSTDMPWGTLTVNALASLVFGVLTGLSGHVSAGVQAVVTTGFCGALSTFSTFSFEVLRLAQEGRRALASGYVAASVLACTGLAAAGWFVAAA